MGPGNCKGSIIIGRTGNVFLRQQGFLPEISVFSPCRRRYSLNCAMSQWVIQIKVLKLVICQTGYRFKNISDSEKELIIFYSPGCN
jgi:hypothetical protein